MTRHAIALIAAACTLFACSDSDKPTGPAAQQDAGPLSNQGLKQPTALERPPTGPGLPADLKPPGR